MQAHAACQPCLAFFMSIGMNNLKYVQFEPGAFLSDIDFQTMTTRQRGVYISIILYLYTNGGNLPANNESLCKLCNSKPENFEEDWKAIKHKFKLAKERVTHKRVAYEIKKASKYFTDKRLAGKKGGLAKASNATSSAKAELLAKGSKAKQSKANPKQSKDVELSCQQQEEKSSDSLVLGLRITELVEESFKPFNAREQSTFTNITNHLARYAAGKSPMAFMAKLKEWVKKSKMPTVKIPKAMFVEIVKKETGFKAQSRIL